MKVNFCCPDGEILRVKHLQGKLKTKCTKRKGLENTLEGMKVFLLNTANNSNINETEYVERKLSKLNVGKPDCGERLTISTLFLHESIASNTIELRQYNKTGGREGNVYLAGRPVCGVSWDKNSARVACRMLGYSDGEPAQG